MFSAAKSNGVHGGNPTLGTKSLRFRSSASAYLNRTQGSTTNNLKYTLSLWIKRGNGGNNFIISASPDNYVANQFSVDFNSNNTLRIIQLVSGSLTLLAATPGIFVDFSAWYHVVLVYDSPNSVANNRTLLYVNNVLQTLSYSYGPVAQNATCFLNSNTVPVKIASVNTSPIYFDGYMADINFIDGQALAPSSFASTNGTTGQWSPAQYTGTFGTNGFYLPFNNATSTTTLGYDQSGNGNNWTTNNISLTAGATYDSMNDVPVAYSATAANYAVMNPNDLGAAVTLTNGNLAISMTGTISNASNVAVGTFAVTSGKWYWEVIPTTSANGMFGVADANTPLSTRNWQGANFWGYFSTNGNKYNNGSGSSYGASYTTGDVIGVALDMDAGTVTFYKNGTSQGTAFTGFTGKTMQPVLGDAGASTMTYTINFGQQPFTYTPPSGYNALNTYNLPTPTIAQGNKYMDATLYTGNGTSQSITNAGAFKPDLVWGKSRSYVFQHGLIDSVRGVSKWLGSNSTSVEDNTSGAYVTAFNSNGFTVGTGGVFNNTSDTYVAWQWQAGAGSSSSNTNGTITSTVSVSTTAGFSVLTFASAASSTVGHGLGIAPSMVIFKSRTVAGGYWLIYHVSTGATGYLAFNTTDAFATNSTVWANTAPTSTVFTLGSGATYANYGNCVAYCFAPIAGFSAFGSYTGNGSATGPFIYTGFQPKYVMVKRTDSTGNWVVLDEARSPYNSSTNELFPNLTNVEDTSGNFTSNILSNGFQVTSTNSDSNASGGTYIYACFASNPFAYSNAH